MSKKVWVMIGALCAAAAAAAVVCVVLAGGKNAAYRSIMVYQVNGNATITRERAGEMQAYENLMLQSGDTVAVASESSMRLKLDDDKYILAEQDTLMNIVAEGDSENSRTYIDLQKGSITSEIQNKLKEGASYEVNTPNSIMAVRGTIFRVDVELDANGDPHTKLTVLQGTVAAKAVMPDGTVTGEEISVEAGNELMIDGTPETFDDLSTPEEIDYDSLPPIVTEYIEELKQSGTLLARNETGNEAVENADGADMDAQAPGQQPDQNIEVPQTPESGQSEVQQAESEESEEQEAAQPEAAQKEQDNNSKTPEKPQKKPSEEEQPEQSEQQKSEEQESKPQMTEQPETTSSEAQESEEESQSKPQESASQTEPSSQAPSGGSSGDSSGGSSGDSSGGSSGGGSSDTVQYYTVTFQYNGSTFGTQKVKKGETAAEPKLSPAPNGSWDYDFSTKVNKNLVIQWKEQ